MIYPRTVLLFSCCYYAYKCEIKQQNIIGDSDLKRQSSVIIKLTRIGWDWVKDTKSHVTLSRMDVFVPRSVFLADFKEFKYFFG